MTASRTSSDISNRFGWLLSLLFCVVCCLGVDSNAEGATVRDEFDVISYGGNNGTANWVGDWVEFGESNGPSAGFLRASATGPCTAGNCMRLGIDGDNDNKYLWREVNLSGAGSATFTFDYSTDQGDRGFIHVEVSGNGGGSWTNLVTYDIGSSGSGSESFDISAYIASDTRVRFRGTNRDDDPFSMAQFRGFMNFDNIQIEYFGPPGMYYWQQDSGTSVAGFTTDTATCSSQEQDIYIITLMVTGGFNCTNFRMEGRAAVPQNLWLIIKDTVYAVATEVTGIDFALNFLDDASGGVTARYELGYVQAGVFTSFGFVDEGPNSSQSTYITDLSSISGIAPAGSHLALRIVDVAPSSGDMRMFTGSNTSGGILNVTELAVGASVCPGGVVTTTVDSTTGGSLRACIIWANGNPGVDTLNVPAGTYTLTIAGTSEDAAATGDLDITDSIIINGNAAAPTIVNGNSIDRVFDILGASTTFTNLTVSGGSVTGNGGGIAVDATGSLTMSTSTISGNSGADGGGIASGGTVNLTNVTVSGNTADDGAGLHCNAGSCTLTNVTVSGNIGTGLGRGLNCEGSCTATFLNTIVANNGGAECAGTPAALVSNGHNLSSDASCDFTAGFDQQNTDPLLGPLQNNGGPTSTHDLLVGSTAIEGGTNTGCPATDQRGTARPEATTCDIGAVEGIAPVVGDANMALTKSDSADPVPVSTPFTYTLTATNNGPDAADNVTVVDTLPADVAFQDAIPSQGSCTHSGEPTGGTVTCTLGTIANTANATIDIEVDAPITTGGINNSATVTADQADADLTDNTANEPTTIVVAEANLRVTQVDLLDPDGVNLPHTYTVTVTNQGPGPATGVTLVDTLDAAVTFVSAVPSQGSCLEAAGVVTCTLGAITNGASATIVIIATAPPTPQTITNTAVVSGTEPDFDLSDNTSVEDTAIINPPPADLQLTKTDSPDPVLVSTALTYTLTVTNLGSGPATNVLVVDTLPPTVTFVSASPSTGSCNPPSPTVDCDLGTLSNGAVETIVIIVTAPASAGVITNNAIVSTSRVDPNPANDTASVDTVVTIPGSADLSLSKSDTPDPVNVAQTLAYSLTVDNLGPDEATGVVLVDTLPATVAYQSAVPSQGSCVHSGEPLGGTVTCTLGTIADAANATATIFVTAPLTTGTITNNASVSGAVADSNPANDNVSEDTTVQNININQLCYLVADAGGGGGGNDLLTRIDTADFDPVTNETNIGIGTGTFSIEAIAWNSATSVLYAADAGRLGILNTTTGVFAPLPSTFGTGNGALGAITFTDVDGLAYDATTGILFGVEVQGGTDVMIQINMATGAHIPDAFGAGVDYVPLPPVLGNSITDDIAIDATTGIMYAAVNAGGSTDRLISINKLTGATTDIALITVPDIEGLGTDVTGQLWGTSGTQGILYEISKTTGVGSNGRTIDNGFDYESVDCDQLSPGVAADLAVTKGVDDPTPDEGDTITYTVNVTNNGPNNATVIQLSDSLPAGVTFVSATPTQGSYDSFTGNWFIGNLAVSATATLTIQASVNAGTGGSTITNTASISFVSQTDPNPGNDSDSVDINPALPPPPAVCQVDPTGTYIEAENFTGTIVQGTAVFVQEASEPGFNGTGYLRSNGGGTPGSPVDEGKIYNIEFTTSGVYNVWMRGYAVSGGTDSLFVGLNGTDVGALNEGGSYNAWVWTNSLQLGINQITVPGVGYHDFNAWIRENGHLVDGFYLTQGAETPTGGIPPGVPTLDPTACGSAPDIVKRAFWPDGTPIPTGATIPSGVEFKYLLYVNNPGAVINDVTVRDVLDPVFTYQAGTIQVDNSLADCAVSTCTAGEELAIFTAVDATAYLTDAADADVASYTGGSLSVDAGDGNVANLQLDINANAVWAILFSVKMP